MKIDFRIKREKYSLEADRKTVRLLADNFDMIARQFRELGLEKQAEEYWHIYCRFCDALIEEEQKDRYIDLKRVGVCV